MKYTIIKGKGGMGNRMLCAASGILWSKIVDREVYVDWRDGAYAPNNENSFFYFFHNNEVKKNPPVITQDIFPEIWYKHENFSVTKMLSLYDPKKFKSWTIHKKYSINPRKIDDLNQVVVFWHHIGFFEQLAGIARKKIPEFHQVSLKNIIKKTIVDSLSLRRSIKEEISTFKMKEWDVNMIGVHVRYTDRKVNVGNILKSIDKIINDKKKYTIFLCTDSKKIEDLFIQKYSRIVSTKKWLPQEGASMHYNSLCPDLVQNGREALIDMYLLSECDYLVYSNRSTFSQISHTISNLPNQNVIDVDQFSPLFFAGRIIRRLVT